MVLPQGMGKANHDGEGNVDVLHAKGFLDGQVSRSLPGMVSSREGSAMEITLAQ